MKEEEIKIRVTPSLKKDFQDICELENTTMSNKINSFIITEVEAKERLIHEDKIYKFIDYCNEIKLPLKNIFLIKLPMITLLNGEIVDNDSVGTNYFVSTYNNTLSDFISNNTNKKIFLHLIGSDIPNNKIRAIVI